MADFGDRIRKARISRQISQTELARRAGISRQALGAIETGVYQPGVSVALKLARELGETVETLFGDRSFERIEAVMAPVHSRAGGPGRAVALGRVGGRLIAIAHSGAQHTLACAAGVVERVDGVRARIESFRSAAEIDSTLLIAGCDPAVSILADWIVRHHAPVGVLPIGRSSKHALDSLAEGHVHVAGVHLRDRKTGEYNLDAVRRAFGHRRMLLVGFARWELGLATAPGNPRGIRGVQDLSRRALRIVNREKGAGARNALDEAIQDLGLSSGAIAGYDFEVPGHLEVAEAVAAGQADFGMTIRVAADAYGLGFVPVREERYDLAIPEREIEAAPIRAMMEALNSARFARELASLCGYDTSAMGQVAARLG